MSSSELFAGLSSFEIEEVYSRARAKTFFRHESLFRQGEPVHRLIWIQTGRVKVTHANADGNEVLLWVCGSNAAVDVYGDTPHSTHRSTAQAMERCHALVWDYSSIRMLGARYPLINANIARILAARLRELEERFCELATREVSDRLALALMRLGESVGKQSRAGLELELNRRELAQMTGTTLCTISRILSKWSQAGLVLTQRGGVVIPNLARLRRLLQDECLERSQLESCS